MIGHTDAVYSVAFSPDGHRVASGGDNTVRLWNPDIGQVPLANPTYSVDVVALSSDGHLVATVARDGGMVRVFNTDTGQPAGAELTGHTDGPQQVVLSPDG